MRELLGSSSAGIYFLKKRGADRNRTDDLRVTTAPNSHHLFIRV
ncbi:uncharacterized protein METZ01_LOCUS185177 [marine metagenome]|uniref:Uncharacterized protein n=1 Tax=marine metagenome TaxID=408172 RepID=A0A382D442_9ZZZZ